MDVRDVYSILDEMQGLYNSGESAEVAHIAADRLLIELVELLAEEREDQATVKQVLLAWKVLGGIS